MAQSAGVRWSQIGGMVRYESRMQWRSGSWKVLAAGYVVLTIIILVSFQQNGQAWYFSREQLVDHQYYSFSYDPKTGAPTQTLIGTVKLADWLADRTITDQDVERVSVTTAILQTLRISLVFMLAGLPMMISEVIPLDHKLRVREMLNSYPLALTVYLIGKVLNVWANTLKIGLAVLLIVCGIELVLVGGFDPLIVVLDWLVGCVGLLLFAGALAVLVPSFAPSRRSALFAGILLIPFCLMAFAGAITVLFNLPGIIDPLYRFSILMLAPYLPTSVLISNIAGLYAQGVIVLLIVWQGMWAIQRLQQR